MRYSIRKSIDWLVGLLSLIPAGLVMWALYDMLMLVLAGRNVAFGPGWKQWNYVRWMLAPFDAFPYFTSVDCSQIFWSFFFLPAFYGAMGGLAIFSMKTTFGATYSNRRLWAYSLIVEFVIQCPALFLANSEDGLHFWWPAPQTYIPTSTIWLFQITRIILWFLTPYLLYWLALLARRLWQKRHGLPPDASAPDGLRPGQK